MSWKNILLLFTKGYPYWNEELVKLSGEDPSLLTDLHDRGLIQEKNNLYFLTCEGEEAFRETAEEYFYDAIPGEPGQDPAKALLKCRLSLLLNRSFIGRWGVKNFYPGKLLSFYPKLERKEICSLDPSKRPVWKYRDMGVINEIRKAFPQERKTNLNPPISEIEKWMTERNIEKGNLEIDLLFLHYCDFMYYMHKTPPASDTLKLMHADRFYMQFVREEFYSDPISLFEEIGHFHLFLLYYRHLILPGNFDLDIHQQENLNALMYITETEAEAVRFYDRFHPLATELTEAAKPLDIWSLSIEAIETHPIKEDSHFDLFEKIGHRVAITYPPGS